MSQSALQIALLLLAWLLASLPFLNQRLLSICWWTRLHNAQSQKRIVWRALELCLTYVVWLFLALFLQKALGVYQPQAFFPFYPSTFLLFVLLALPAFVWQCLLKRS